MKCILSHRTKGAALVEYGILVGLVAVVAISSVYALGVRVSGNLDNVSSELSGRMASLDLQAADVDLDWPPVPGPNETFFTIDAMRLGASLYGAREDSFGTITTVPDSEFDVYSLYDGGHYSSLFLHGRSLDVDNYTLSCDGTSIAVSEAVRLENSQYYGATYLIQWQPEVFGFEESVQYRCKFAPS